MSFKPQWLLEAEQTAVTVEYIAGPHNTNRSLRRKHAGALKKIEKMLRKQAANA
jgi:hypothetical protein